MACISMRVSHACVLVAFAVIATIAVSSSNTAMIVMPVHQQQLSSSSVVTSDGTHCGRYIGAKHKQQYALAQYAAAGSGPGHLAES